MKAPICFSIGQLSGIYFNLLATDFARPCCSVNAVTVMGICWYAKPEGCALYIFVMNFEHDTLVQC